MARYISEEKLIVSLMDYSKGKKTIGQCVTDTPTEDVVPIIRGKWIVDNNIHCSKCGKIIADFIPNPNDTIALILDNKFCLNCGAKMEESGEEK